MQFRQPTVPALGWLAVDVTPEPWYDDRIAAVPDHLRATPSPPPPVRDLTRIAHLSESRLQHLFRDQAGVPIRGTCYGTGT